MHRSMRRREEIEASRQTRAAQAPPAGPTAAGVRIRPRLRAKGRTAAPALPRQAGARRTAGLAPMDEDQQRRGIAPTLPLSKAKQEQRPSYLGVFV